MFRATHLLVAVTIISFVAFLGSIFFLQEDSEFLKITGVMVAVQSLAVTAAFFLAYQMSPRGNYPLESKYLFLLVLAFGFLMIGDMLWAYFELDLADAVPVGSWPDAFWLTAYVFFFLALSNALMSTRAMETSLARPILWASFLLALGYFLLNLSSVLVEGATEESVIALIQHLYPTADIVLLGFILVLVGPMVRVNKWNFFKTPAGLLALTVISMVMFDVGFALFTGLELYETGDFIDLFYGITYVLAVLSADKQFQFYDENPGKSALGTLPA